MFSDLVGSTAPSGALDPEDMREVVRPYQEPAPGVPAARGLALNWRALDSGSGGQEAARVLRGMPGRSAQFSSTVKELCRNRELGANYARTIS